MSGTHKGCPYGDRRRSSGRVDVPVCSGGPCARPQIIGVVNPLVLGFAALTPTYGWITGTHKGCPYGWVA